jgi:hypothetical protein
MYMRGVGAYYLRNGQPTSVLYVGDSMSFNVPGYSQIWLDQTQNGATQFSGPFSLPMAPYTLLPRDEGMFQANVYELKSNQTRGALIGSDSIRVQPAIALIPAMTPAVSPPPVIQQIPAPGYVPSPLTTSGGGRLISTGVQTPSAPAPAPVVVTVPSGGGYYPEPAIGPDGQPVAAEGMDTSTMLLIGGLVLGGLFLMKGGRK